MMTSPEWTPPVLHKVATSEEVNELVKDERIHQLIDPIEYIADDLFELNHPDRMDDEAARSAFKDEVIEQGAAFGHWVHYPWSDTLVRFPDNDDHYDLRTFRNRNLLTTNEQQTVRRKKIAAFGLSVGSKIVDETVQGGIGNEYMLFDFDKLNPTNLNRIRATMAQVGLYKTTIAGRKMGEIDPYINQTHFTSGYDRITDDILRAERPDVIIEEVDNLEVKARLRRIAEELGIPLVMAGDVADRSTIDIERHDLEKVKPFNGKLSKKDVEAILSGSMSEKDQETALIKILGLKNLSPRLIDSAMARGIELAGFPQLGTTATAGGALATVAIRDIFLDRKVDSIARVYNPRNVLKNGRPTTLSEDIDTIKRFIKYRKDAK